MASICGVEDLKSVMNLYKNDTGFVAVGDWVEVRQGGEGPNAEVRFLGPMNGGSDGAKVGVVAARDFASMGFFFLSLAKDVGFLGDVEKGVKEFLGVVDTAKGQVSNVAKR